MTKEQAIEVLHELDGSLYETQQVALDMAIKALEIVEEFENARIITGGRLNGRTYAYRRGLEDGKRKALEQPTSDDCVSRKAVLNTLFYKSDNNCEVVLGKELRDRIKALPSARKSGLRWIERFDKENKWLECPHCHIDSAEAYNYCPNCGASFKEEK